MPTIESSRSHLSLFALATHAHQNQFITTNTTSTTSTTTTTTTTHINRYSSRGSHSISNGNANTKSDFSDVHNYTLLDYEIKNSTNTNTSLTTATEIALPSRLNEEFSVKNNLIRFKQMLGHLNSTLTTTTTNATPATTAARARTSNAFINITNFSESKSSDAPLATIPSLEISTLKTTTLSTPSASSWFLTKMSSSTTTVTPKLNFTETYTSPQYNLTVGSNDQIKSTFATNNVYLNFNATIFTPPQPYALSLTSSGGSSPNSNYDGDNGNIALIDSSETLLADAAHADYTASMGFGVDSETHADSMHRSMVHGLGRVHSAVRKNVNMKQIFDGGGTNAIESDASAVDKAENAGGSSFMLLFEDFGEYFYNYNNGSSLTGTTIINNSNITLDLFNRTNCTNSMNYSTTCLDLSEEYHNYWALILLLFPILTLFGNILVILAVCRERSLQSVTNYFIVSLAIADLLVAVVPMPFAVYILVNGTWALPNVVCDFYIAMDVICSTSSIFNLVAISIDRYIAVTQPIKYAKHKNSRRVCLTILLVWAISAAIGSPIVMGLNNTPNRDPDLCVFYNTDFVLYSSLSSFYIPCIIMVFLYWSIFKALNRRARKQRAARKPHLSELTGGSVIENIAQTRRLAETALDSGQGSRVLGDEPATNTASGSNEEEDENAISPDIDDCHVIVNDKSTEFMLATVVEETGNVVAQISSPPQLVVADPNGNHDSGYAPSNVDDVLAGAAESSPPDSPAPSGILQRSNVNSGRRNTPTESSPKREAGLSVAMKPLAFVRYGVQEAMTLARNDSTLSTTSRSSARKDKKNSQASRFTIYKVHKASKKKREKSSAKKERKATKTLAIVLGVFLFCWLPFFTCNVMDGMCAKFNTDCRPGVTAFMLTTWLGYINSFVNPVIYTIFNPEFRKAFKKIMHMG